MPQTGPQSPAEEQAQDSATQKESEFSPLRDLPLPLRGQPEALGLDRTVSRLIESGQRFRDLVERTASYAFRAVSGRGLCQQRLEFQRGCFRVFALPLKWSAGASDVPVS